MIHDALTWPETYAHEYAILGHDLAGTVAAVFSGNSPFKPGDEVFGMAHADRGSAWAEYVLVKANEIALKPAKLSWDEAAAVPLSAQTAYEALFVHAGVPLPSSSASASVSDDGATAPTKSQSQTILITGAAGGVGIYLVQLAHLAGLHVVAASSSNARNASFLRDLGADETLEYADLPRPGRDRINTNTEINTEITYDIIIDTVGGDVLAGCWDLVNPSLGCLISVDSASFDFVREHEQRELARGTSTGAGTGNGVKALFFIVQGSNTALAEVAHFADKGKLRVLVLDRYPLGRAVEAYERASEWEGSGRGKIALTV